MLKGKMIHPEIIETLSLCGHGCKVLIADGNYPLKSPHRRRAPGISRPHAGPAHGDRCAQGTFIGAEL